MLKTVKQKFSIFYDYLLFHYLSSYNKNLETITKQYLNIYNKKSYTLNGQSIHFRYYDFKLAIIQQKSSDSYIQKPAGYT